MILNSLNFVVTTRIIIFLIQLAVYPMSFYRTRHLRRLTSQAGQH